MEVGFRAGTILLGKYRIESVVGRGGMGVVLRVTHLQLGEELAIKVLLPEATSAEGHARFLREAQSVVRLRGEHVTRVIDVGLLPEGVPYMVMEYLRGLDLADELSRRGALPPGEAVDYVLQACEALAEAHAYGIVHRDIKPGNLFLTKRPDGTPLIKVLDFGISKAPVGARGGLTKTDSVMGTPGYMSPEQMKAAKDADARTDVWALGIILYECLTGRRPFDAEAFSAVVLMAATEPPPPMDRKLPRALQAAVLRCLEKQREARFSSMAELAAALAPFARDHRAAAVIVDRTGLLARGASAASEHTAGPLGSPTATTLSGSAGASQVRMKRRNYAVIGITSLLLSIGGVALVALTGSERRAVTRAASAVEGDVTAPLALDAAAVSQAQPVDARDVGGERAQRAKSDECSHHKREHEWQALEECADALQQLGGDDAAAFRTTARHERANAFSAQQLHDALRAGNLKSGQTWLGKVDPDSAYFASARDDLARAETLQSEGALRKAKGLAKLQQCDALDQYVSELNATSTERVVAIVQEVRCTRATPPAASPTAPAASPPARATSPTAPAASPTAPAASPTAPAASPTAPAASPPARAASPSGSPAASATAPAASAASPTTPASSAAAASKTGCAALNTNDAMAQAERLHKAGRAKEALATVVRALGCKQDYWMYQSAVQYACSAGDAAKARLYFPNAPAAFQPILEAQCKQNNISLRPPAATESKPTPPVDPCDGIDTDALAQQAAKLYSDGAAKPALATVLKALACKQDDRLFRFAVVYACVAHDVATAKLYFAKAADTSKANLEQKCQQEGLDVRAP